MAGSVISSSKVKLCIIKRVNQKRADSFPVIHTFCRIPLASWDFYHKFQISLQKCLQVAVWLNLEEDVLQLDENRNCGHGINAHDICPSLRVKRKFSTQHLHATKVLKTSACPQGDPHHGGWWGKQEEILLHSKVDQKHKDENLKKKFITVVDLISAKCFHLDFAEWVLFLGKRFKSPKVGEYHTQQKYFSFFLLLLLLLFLLFLLFLLLDYQDN